MRKILISLLLVCSMLVSFSCITISKSSSAPTFTPTPASTLSEAEEILTYYKEIKPALSDTQYDRLLEMYDDYGLEIYFNYYWTDTDYTIAYKDLDSDQYGTIVDTIYDALMMLGSDELTKTLISESFNEILCNKSMQIDDIEYNSYVHSYYWGQYYLSFSDPVDTKELAVLFMGFIAYNNAGESALNDAGFIEQYYNGFKGYFYGELDDEVGYLSYLDSYGIDDPYRAMIECLKAGVMHVFATNDFRYDFSEYIKACMSSETSLWWAYPSIEPIRTKTNAALQYIESVNPAWGKDFFIEFSDPANADALYEPMSSELSYIYFYDDGTYYGTYENSTGTMNATLHIDEIDNETGKLVASFSFCPVDGNLDGKSGEYRMVGNVNFRTSEVFLKGEEWISEQPRGYNMLDINGMLFATRLIGEFNREELTEIVLDRAEDDFYTD